MKLNYFILCLFLIVSSTAAKAQQERYVPNLTQLIEQSQLTSEDIDKMSLIWWIPKEFWFPALTDDPSFSAIEIAEFEAIFKNYTVILAVDGVIGRFGNVAYSSAEEISANIEIYDDKSNRYTPLKEKAIPNNLKDIFGVWKPMFASMLGAMGENINFYVFQNNYNSEVMDASGSDQYVIKMMGEEYKFRLPLGVLFPPKTCGKCGDEFMGTYKYCPYDRNKL